MRRLARWLFTLCAAVSLLLCVAVCVLWVRSYYACDAVWMESPSRIVSIQSSLGKAGFYGVASTVADLAEPGPPVVKWQSFETADLVDTFISATMSHSWGDFSWTYGGIGTKHYQNVLIPYWCVAAAAAAAALLLFRGAWAHNLRYGRMCRGLCPQCGYDLRAAPGRCPECGAVPKVNA